MKVETSVDSDRTVRDAIPSGGARSLLSIWVVIHLGLVFTSLSTLVPLTELQTRVVNVATPYLSPLHLRVDDRNLAFALFIIDDWPHQIQWRRAGEDQWRTGSAGTGPENSWRMHRLAVTIANAAEQEDTATASMLMVPWIRRELGELSGVASVGDQFQVRVLARIRGLSNREFELLGIDDPVEEDSNNASTRTLIRAQLTVACVANETAPSGLEWVMVTTEPNRLNALPPTTSGEDDSEGTP